MKIEKFEDILAWQKARLMTKDFYGASMTEPFRSDFGLRGQLQRASVSTMSNIAEGFERGGNKEFLQFLSHAKGSCGEVRSDLYVALDQGYLTTAKFEQLREQSLEVSRLLSGFMDYLRNSELRGDRFRKRQ